MWPVKPRQSLISELNIFISNLSNKMMKSVIMIGQPHVLSSLCSFLLNMSLIRGITDGKCKTKQFLFHADGRCVQQKNLTKDRLSLLFLKVLFAKAGHTVAVMSVS